MLLRLLTWLFSLGAHFAFAAFMLAPAGGTALEQGAGEDIMVVEQGMMLEGFAKLGEDQVAIEEVQAPPVQMAMAQPLPEEVKQPVEQEKLPVEEPEEVKPIEERQVVASESGPDQLDVKAPEEIEEPEPEELEEPVREEVKEPQPEVVKQPLPQQVATLQQESVAAQRESSGVQKKGGDTTTHTAYLGTLRTHLEKHKVNLRTELIGTAVVQFTVDANGGIAAHKITKSSGSKVLDDAAIASIEKSAPFPPIPKGLNRDRLEISVPFKFTVR
ncbi:MAG: TonB family protein [Methyloceanibacter sp.]|uniref:energy transducer TonB family protein n=1 Tax=Methyloceanibacter sp. TaxID=1965321 RepID=UPI003D9B4FD2